MTGSAQQAAGWFPDPHDAAQLRWWDGVQWTDHCSPGIAPVAEREQARAQPNGVPHSWTGDRFVAVQGFTTGSYTLRTLSDHGGSLRDAKREPVVGKAKTKMVSLTDTYTLMDAAGTKVVSISTKALSTGKTYTITDAMGTEIGRLEKKLLSAKVENWKLYGTCEEPIAVLTIESVGAAVTRRLIGGAASKLIPKSFSIVTGPGALQITGQSAGQPLGRLAEKRARREIDLSLDALNLIDRRVIMAVAVMLHTKSK